MGQLLDAAMLMPYTVFRHLTISIAHNPQKPQGSAWKVFLPRQVYFLNPVPSIELSEAYCISNYFIISFHSFSFPSVGWILGFAHQIFLHYIIL
jgi:hypothetical protein